MNHSSFPSSCLPVILLSCGLALAGCAGWTDGYAGPAYTTAGRLNQSGPAFGVESIFTPKPHTTLNRGGQPFPIGLHNAFQLMLSPDVKTFSWLTGLAYFSQPDPVSGYVIAGTNLHFDLLDSHFSFGNFQPYGEAGVAAKLGGAEESDGLVATLGLQFMFLYNYLAPADEPRTNAYLTVKFGIGWDVH
jgi:hypothetical protein